MSGGPTWGQLSLDRVVALEVIAPDLATDEEFRERFKHEARLAASIEHANVLPVYEAGERDGLLYLIMRYVEPTTASSVVGIRGSGPRSAVTRWATSIRTPRVRDQPDDKVANIVDPDHPFLV